MAAEIWFGGKEKLLALGSIPRLLCKRRENEKEKAHAILREGRDPGAEKKARKQKQAQEPRTPSR